MRLRTLKFCGVGMSVGFVVGLVMLALAIDWKDATFGNTVLGSRNAMRVWRIIHGPAWLAAKCWHGAGLPPQNEGTWFFTPLLMVLAQWTLSGLVAGFWWEHRVEGQALLPSSPGE